MTSLKDQVVLITGGATGYGKATAKLFAREGAQVIIASRNEKNLQQAQAETQCADYFVMDVTCPDNWEKIYQFIMKKYHRLDILINNAGAGITLKETLNQSVEDIDKIIKTNLNSVIYGSRIFGNLMKEQKSGTILNVASVCAKQAWPEWTIYATAKWGVLGFSKGLYVELQPHNVRVTCIIPAAASTSFQSRAGIDEVNMKLQPDDVAQAMLDVCKLPSHVVVEEITVWGIDQIVNPL